MRPPKPNGKACLEWAIQLPPLAPTGFDPDGVLMTDILANDTLTTNSLAKASVTDVASFNILEPDLPAVMKDYPAWEKSYLTRLKNIRAKIDAYVLARREQAGALWADRATLEALSGALYQLFRRSRNTAFVSCAPKIIVRPPDQFFVIRVGLASDRNKHVVLRLLTGGDAPDTRWHLIPPLTNEDDGMVGL